MLVCVNCGVEKRCLQFPKRGGLTYEKLKATDPRRYDTQCKLCKKPRPSDAGPDYVHKEPKTPGIGRPKKKKTKQTRKVAARSKQQVRIETRVRSMLYLSARGCEECGERDPRKLEYDHKDPVSKTRSVSRIITDGYSWAADSLREEVRKCRVLCANCHRVHTIKQQGYYASSTVKKALRGIASQYGFRP